MNADEQIIVSMTSWKKRINGVHKVIDKLLQQTLLPNKIILNLASDEFLKKEKDLPNELLKIINEHSAICEIYWVKEDTKPYKKLMPTLLRFPNDIIITVDDDIIYPNDFIENIYREYLSWGKQCPITCGSYTWNNGIYTHYGAFSLIKKEFFGDYIFDLYNNLYLKHKDELPFSDLLFTYAILLNGKRYKFTNKMDMTLIRNQIGNDSCSLSHLGNEKYIKLRNNEHEVILDYIKRKYGKTYDDLFKAKIHVNLTTWKMRDGFVYDMLKNFQNQTLKPDKIILWLAREEYDENNIPNHLKQCLNEGLLTDIMWVDKNIYCHKRHECFRFFNDVYNVFIDDDILYEPNFLKEIVNHSMKYQNYVTCTAGYSQSYEGTRRIIKPFIEGSKPSLNNQFLGCWMCFPPYSFPLESYNFTDLRDKYVPKCDEGWLVAWFIKKNIKVNLIHNFGTYKQKNIGDSQENALYNENKKIESGVRVKEKMFSNALVCTGMVEEAKKIWPKFDIYACCDKELLKSLGKENLIESEPVVTTHKDDIKQVVEHDDAPIYITESKPVKKQTIIRHTDTITKIKKKPPVKKLRTFIQRYDRLY